MGSLTPNRSSLETRYCRADPFQAHVRGSLLRIPPSRTFRRQGHEANRGRRSHQIYHRQGGVRHHHKGRTKGPKEEITRCNARSWGFHNEKIRKKNCNQVSSLLSLNCLRIIESILVV